MKTYNYQAIKRADGQKVEGKIEAETEKEARLAIGDLGLIPIKVFDPNSSAASEFASRQKQAEARKKIRLSKLKAREKIDFTGTLQILLKSGVPLIEALVFMQEDSDSKRIKNIAGEIRKQVIAGSSFADIIAKYPQIFDNLYLGLVRAGEEAGELDITLGRIERLLKKQDDIKSKVIGIMVYPCIVLFFAAVIVVVMLTFVFPSFAEMYEGLNAELPWITQTCIDAGRFISNYWVLFPIFGCAIYFFIKFVYNITSVKRAVHSFLLSIPLIKEFVKLVEFSNFVSVLLVAYEAGVPIVDCLYLANYTVNNLILYDAIKVVAIKTQQGLHLSSALKSSQVMPPILLFMVSTGEQSGKLGEMLAKASDYIDNKLDRIIDILTKFIEPIMLLFIGAVVLVLALALYLPLFQSYSHIGT